MGKHSISILTLLVVSTIAMLSLLFDTREQGHLTAFGYAVAILTGISFILGVAAEIHTAVEKAREEAAERAKFAEQKQQLTRIEAETTASTRPLLPVAVFYTLRHTTTAEPIDRAFSGVSGFKTVRSDLLRLVGSARLGGPLGYNSIQLDAIESHCILKGDDLQRCIKGHTGMGESVIRQPMHTTLEFFFSSDGVVPEEPSLILEKTVDGSGNPNEVKHIELFDNVIFQDSFVRDWTTRTESGRSWCVDNLRNARVRFRLNLLGEYGPASLHNLQLFFGPTSAMHAIEFPLEILNQCVFKEDPSPLFRCNNDLATQFFKSYLLEFDWNLSDEFMGCHFTKVVAR